MPEKGRPASDYIFRFNVATDLLQKDMFIAFKLALGTDEREAWTVLVRLWNFVAQNGATTGKIDIQCGNVLADFCWFSGEPKTLIDALLHAKIINSDGIVADWFSSQPYASKIVSQRKNPRRPEPAYPTPDDETEPPQPPNDATEMLERFCQLLGIGKKSRDRNTLYMMVRAAVDKWGIEAVWMKYGEVRSAMRTGTSTNPIGLAIHTLKQLTKQE
jgi:hypothetical protein